MAATGSNQFSSRSHAIIQIILEQQKEKSREFFSEKEFLSSKLLIVDLAGSERGGSAEKGIRSQEGSNINTSLLALGRCINLLSDKSKTGSFVPYRDSKLTRLLKDSLGGNISTVMISCVSMLPEFYDETINTLKYSSRARTIEKKVSTLLVFTLITGRF
jgi:kinesin family protein 18/19